MDEFLSKIENYDKPKDGIYSIYLDYYWIVDKEGFPLQYKKFNQCNRDIEIINMIFNNAYKNSKIGVGVKLIPIVYVKYNR